MKNNENLFETKLSVLKKLNSRNYYLWIGGSASVSPDVSAIKNIDASATRHVEAPVDKPQSERQEKTNQNICVECERLIV